MAAAFMQHPPEQFNFDKPKTWKSWPKRFERYRVASKLDDDSEKFLVNQLIYCVRSKADEFFSTFQLTEAEAALYETIWDKFDAYFNATKSYNSCVEFSNRMNL